MRNGRDGNRAIRQQRNGSALACHVRSRLDRYRGDEGGVAARGGRCRAMPDGFKSRKSRAWERLVNELNKSINDAFNTAVALAVAVVVVVVVVRRSRDSRGPPDSRAPRASPSDFGRDRSDPNQHRPTLQLLGSSRHLPGFRAVSNRYPFRRRAARDAKKRRCSTGSMVRRDAVGLTRGDRGLSVAWRLRTAKSRHGPKPGRHRVAHGRTASLLR
jgi:hypothetical protein